MMMMMMMMIPIIFQLKMHILRKTKAKESNSCNLMLSKKIIKKFGGKKSTKLEIE